jgi:hypothetical protein
MDGLLLLVGLIAFVALVTSPIFDMYSKRLCVICLAVVAVCLVAQIPFQKACNMPRQIVVKSEYQIVAVKDGTETEGNVHGYRYYRSVSISGVQYYYYMINTDKGLKQYKVSGAYIIETDETPHITTMEYEFVDDNWLRSITAISCYELKDEYYIYVPRGTVVKDFEIDME